MSEAFDRGRDAEREVAALIRKKLKVHVQRDKQSGAGTNKSDIRDYYQEIPLSIEVKDQETLKVKEWMRQTIDAASFNQTPTLVFRMDTELMAVVPFSNLLDFLLEIAELRAENDDLRKPYVHIGTDKAKPASDKTVKHLVEVGKAVTKQLERGAKTCRNGHISDDYGYCNIIDCKFSRGYRTRKVRK